MKYSSGWRANKREESPVMALAAGIGLVFTFINIMMLLYVIS